MSQPEWFSKFYGCSLVTGLFVKSCFGILLRAAFALWDEVLGVREMWTTGKSDFQVCSEVMPMFLLTICFQIKKLSKFKETGKGK